MNIKRIFIALLLLAPLFANAQNSWWFKANTMRYTDEYEEWQEWQTCNVTVSFDVDNDWRLKLFMSPTNTITIRKIKDYGNMVDDDGNTHYLWYGIDNEGLECTLALVFYETNVRLTIAYEYFQICYIIEPDI